MSREYAQLSDVSRCFTDWQQIQDDIETAQTMLDDPEMREMAQEELREAKDKSEQLEQQLQVLLLPKDRTMSTMRFWKFAPGLAVMKRPYLPVICFACTAAMPKHAAGAWRS